MFKKMIIGASAASAIALSSGAAQAQGYVDADTGFYLEGGYSYLDIEPDGAKSGVDTNAFTARAGYQFNRNFSLEGDITTGVDDDDFGYDVREGLVGIDDNADGDLNDVINANGNLELNYLVGLYGKAALPVTDRFDVFARAGYAFIDMDASVRSPSGAAINTIEDSDDGVALGAGAEYQLSERWNVRADYTWYDFEDTETQAAMIGVGYKF